MAPSNDWDPRSVAVLEDQCTAYDALRRRCPVAYSEFLGWSIFRHRDVLRVLLDHEAFSNAVSPHRSVPNGMDPPEHAEYRKIIEPYFTAERMDAFEPVCRELAVDLLQGAGDGTSWEWIGGFAVPFALRCQCAFLGWPERLAEPLGVWTRKSQAVTLAGDRAALTALAAELTSYVTELLAARRRDPDAPEDDGIARLLAARVRGKPLTDEEIVSVLRNWTVGEIGSISAALGTIVHRLAADPELQSVLRAEPERIPHAIEEMLRIAGPLVANRRVTTRDTEIGGRRIPAGERVTVMWISANRDEEVFEAPEELRWDRDTSDHLVYGAGIHVCPGAPLARLELRVATEELLRRSDSLRLAPDQPVRPAAYPANGPEELHLILA